MKKIHKIFVCAAVLLLSVESLLFAQAKNVVMFTSDFEDGTTQQWKPRGDKGAEEKLASVTEAAHSGKRSLKISDRKYTWHGPIHFLTDNAVAGDIYSIHLWLYYNEGPANAAFTLSIERSFKDESLAHSYTNIAAVQAKKGEWTEVKLEYTVGPDPTQKNIWLYFERPYKSNDQVTADDKISFFLDDIEVVKLDPALKPKIEENIPSLYEVYSDYFDIGTAVSYDEVDTTNQKSRLLMKHFTGIVCGNEMKWENLQPAEGKFDWTKSDKIVEFGELTGMRIRGHTLCWHSQTPAWVFQSKKDPKKKASKAELDARLKNHIESVMKHYKDSIESYDVVNEVLSDSTGKLRTEAEGSKWFGIMGEEYIEKAFRYARAADKNAQLVINDYNLVSDKRKRQGMYDLVKRLKAKGVPVDAIGMQMHISVNTPSITEIEETFKLFESLGVNVLVTELDVSIHDSDSAGKKPVTDAVLKAQAQRYKELFDVFKASANRGKLDLVMIWGLEDGGSWKNDFPVPGRGDAPLLFDSKLKAKPAFWSLVK